MSKPTERLSWEEPPKITTRPRTKFSEAARKLKARKGEWAKVADYPKAGTAATIANIIKTGRSRFFEPAGAFEAVSRTVEGEHRVYARYVGEEKEDERSAPNAPEGA